MVAGRMCTAWCMAWGQVALPRQLGCTELALAGWA